MNEVRKSHDRDEPVAATERVWVPDRRWTTEPEIIAGKLCRRQGPGHKACRQPAIAAVARSNGWWCYCIDHLYGHALEDGVVKASVSADSPAAERGFTR